MRNWNDPREPCTKRGPTARMPSGVCKPRARAAAPQLESDGAGDGTGIEVAITQLAGAIEHAPPGLATACIPGKLAALIAKRIRSLAEENDVPVYAFAEDVAASGGYWLACAADEIYAMESSIVGSIGVISAGFGFSGLLKRIGVERRVHTAGTRKGLLDPFLVENQDDVKRLKAIQGDIHETFKAQVLDRRAGRIKVAEDEIFNGEFWTGRGALDRGLIDDLGDLRTVMRTKFGERVKLRAVGSRQSWWRRGRLRSAIVDGGDGWALADGILAAVEERLWWNRFGL